VVEEVITQAGRQDEETKVEEKTDDDFMKWLEKLDPDDFKYKM
jgi:hypothetical protein